MKYRLEISSVAEAEADSDFLRLSQITSPTRASQWYSGLLHAIESLSQMPKRCSLARENEYFSQEIRQLLYGTGRNSYRILFTLGKGKKHLQFAFCTFDMRHSRLLGKIQKNLTKSNKLLNRLS